MKLQPMGRSILVKLCSLEDELKQRGSIIHIPKEIEMSSALLCEAVVLEIGPEVKTVIPGDKIIFSKHAFSQVHTRYGEQMAMMQAADVVAKIIKEEVEA